MTRSLRILLIAITFGSALGLQCVSAVPVSSRDPSDQQVAAAPTKPTEAMSAESTTASSLDEEIRAANRSMEQAFRTGKTHEVAQFYADDAVMLAPGGGRYSGRTEIDAYWTRITEPVDWKLDVLSVEGEDALAVERGQSTLIYRKQGAEHTSVVQFMLVWVRVEGKWRISVDAYWS